MRPRPSRSHETARRLETLLVPTLAVDANHRPRRPHPSRSHETARRLEALLVPTLAVEADHPAAAGGR